MQSSHNAMGVSVVELFVGETKSEIFGKMDARKAELKQNGHTGFKRASVGRNAPCPCGSGQKLKKCCLDKAR